MPFWTIGKQVNRGVFEILDSNNEVVGDVGGHHFACMVVDNANKEERMVRKKANPKKEEGTEMSDDKKKNGDLAINLERSQSSLTVKLNSKGGHEYEIKIYADNIGEAVEAMKQAKYDVEKQLGLKQ